MYSVYIELEDGRKVWVGSAKGEIDASSVKLHTWDILQIANDHYTPFPHKDVVIVEHDLEMINIIPETNITEHELPDNMVHFSKYRPLGVTFYTTPFTTNGIEGFLVSLDKSDLKKGCNALKNYNLDGCYPIFMPTFELAQILISEADGFNYEECVLGW